MPPTRSASSRSKKRSSMKEALDLLNNVMSGKDLAADKRQTQSAHSVRQLRNLPRAPRREIWDVPDSPHRALKAPSRPSPRATNKPLTPQRRSTRIKSQEQAKSNPTMTRTQAAFADVGHVEQNTEEDLSQHSQQASEDESNKMEDESDGEDIDYNGNLNVFSDDASPSRSSSIKSPTPSATLREDLERVERTQTTPRKPQTPRRVTEIRSGERRSARLSMTTGQATRSTMITRSAAEPGPSVLINRSPSKVRETPNQKKNSISSPLLRSHMRDADGDVTMDDESTPSNGHPTAAADDTGSLFVPSESSTPSPEGAEPSLPKTPLLDIRSGKLRQPTKSLTPRSGKSVSIQKSSRKSVFGRIPDPPHADFIWSPSPNASTDSSADSQSFSNYPEDLLPSSSLVIAPHAERSESYRTSMIRRPRKRSWRRVSSSQRAPEPESPYPRCKEAMAFGGQQDNWKALIREVRLMECQPDRALMRCFQDILGLIAHFQKWYEDLPNDPETHHGLPLKEARRSEKLLDSIQIEGDYLLDTVYYRVTKRKQSSQERGQKTFQEFEARVIPAVVQLVFAAFDAYHTDPIRFAPIYQHLHRGLSLVLRFCNRMRSLAKEQYVRCITRSKNLLLPLQSLIDASESNALNKLNPQLEAEPESESDSSSDSNSMVSIPSDDISPPASSHRPFSDVEGCALLDGLQQHQDTGRYILIQRDFSALEGRTLRELREEARRMCDAWEPLIRDELVTREGRENWGWLLSVRERDL
ncbi:hypothetical protein BJX64DRAFT_263579 [Aspergillus heterothallicus]